MSSCLETKLCFEEVDTVNVKYPVIIVAAGSASRMKGIDKIFAEINGLSVIARSVLAFDINENISELVVVTRGDKVDEIKDLLGTLSLAKPFLVTEGGVSREHSVLNGILALKKREGKAIVHDAARPLVSESVINGVVKALATNDSVACAVKVKDTIKVINEDMLVEKTLNRDFLVSIQTPQGVCISKFCDCADKYDLNSFTDDTSVLEAVGTKTFVTEGDYKNIKITTPEDIVIAEAYLRREA